MKHTDSNENNIKKEWLVLLQNSNTLGISNEQIKMILDSKVRTNQSAHG